MIPLTLIQGGKFDIHTNPRDTPSFRDAPNGIVTARAGGYGFGKDNHGV